jgi:AraC family transcriptional regulator of adaptative response/methylated-DNA-[protein]-cysteine methyltransferase
MALEEGANMPDMNTIRFATGESALGAVLVAMTDRGVCAIELGDDRDALVRHLRQRFGTAELEEDGAALADMLARVVAQLDGPRSDFFLPLDVRGTAFQERVWGALKEIPVGAVATYAEVALRIGEPKAVRAVAQACAANPAAVAIPCHRVVRSDGSSGGYRWGIARKEALLERERAA